MLEAVHHNSDHISGSENFLTTSARFRKSIVIIQFIEIYDELELGKRVMFKRKQIVKSINKGTTIKRDFLIDLFKLFRQTIV